MPRICRICTPGVAPGRGRLRRMFQKQRKYGSLVAAGAVALALSMGVVVSAQTRAEITLEDLVSIGSIGSPALSPDGHELALVQEGQIVLVPSEGGWPS